MPTQYCQVFAPFKRAKVNKQRYRANQRKESLYIYSDGHVQMFPE